MDNKKICAIVLLMMFVSGFFLTTRAESSAPVEYNKPYPVPLNDRWGNDLRIGDQDSIYDVELDIHRQSGNLFAVLLHPSPTSYSPYCRVYFSSNSGNNWSLGNSFVGTTTIKAMSATVLKNHLYVAFTYGPYSVRMRRYRFSNGQVDTFSNGQISITIFSTTPPDSIKEIALVSDQDFLNMYMNLFAITQNGSLRYFYSDTAGVNWYGVSNSVTGAIRGLDACTNEGFANYYALTTHINNGDSIQIDGFDYAGNRTLLRKLWAGPNSSFTSVGAYHDTIIAVYERSGYAVAYYIRCAVSYQGGTNWVIYNLTDTNKVAHLPDVTARDNGGQGVVYAYGASADKRIYYKWRPYYGSWSDSVQIGDYRPSAGVKPAIEYLGNNRYGCVYVSYSPIYGGAYFDRSDWTGIAEEIANERFNSITISPNPSNGAIKISFSMIKSGNVKISLYDLSGRYVESIIDKSESSGKHSVNLKMDAFPSGIYFVKVELPEGTFTRPINLIR